MSLSRDDKRQAIFGISDGAATTVGAMFGLFAAGHRAAILPSSLSVGLAALLSMGMGEYLADDSSSIHRALAMTAGTALGGLAPAVPFLLGDGTGALLAAIGVMILLGVWVARERAATMPVGRSVVQVFAVFTIIGAATYGAGLLL